MKTTVGRTMRTNATKWSHFTSITSSFTSWKVWGMMVFLITVYFKQSHKTFLMTETDIAYLFSYWKGSHFNWFNSVFVMQHIEIRIPWMTRSWTMWTSTAKMQICKGVGGNNFRSRKHFLVQILWKPKRILECWRRNEILKKKQNYLHTLLLRYSSFNSIKLHLKFNCLQMDERSIFT